MPGHPALHEYMKKLKENSPKKSLGCSMGGNKYHRYCDLKTCQCQCHVKTNTAIGAKRITHPNEHKGVVNLVNSRSSSPTSDQSKKVTSNAGVSLLPCHTTSAIPTPTYLLSLREVK